MNAFSFKNIYKSPAKINRCLKIGRYLDNGYHEIASTMQFLTHCDILKFVPNFSSNISIFWSGKIEAPPFEKNLIVKSANCLRNYLQNSRLGAEIYIEKVIPVGAGLGGGSSNAATAFFALNQLWKSHLTKEVLITLSKSIGTDVAFFLYGRSAKVSGLGFTFCPIDEQECDCFLIPPIYGPQNTTLAFAQIKKMRSHQSSLSFALNQCNKTTDWTNDFEKSLKELSFDTWTLLQQLRVFGLASLTGSGNALIVVPKKNYRLKLCHFLTQQKIPYILTQTINHSPLFEMEKNF